MTDTPSEFVKAHCRICERRMGLRSRAIVGICLHCDTRLEGYQRIYFADKFGSLVFNPKTAKYEVVRE